ncbi:curli-like amyloid fiber formation chaperone CsgH [Rhizobium sp. S152]|uniref:curli-like amyloid fiber formation chaperone CsgH n=1 Tax=Rhizobium sp. S152 TaxID=3055038 RepID=UPI0025A9FE86|nr:curli-like amyloid fiber formation chaperone CsgH [Rhizobium sp. S152]MDM9625799.1 curli-like amyloid fiber formation chaperone CsgH [Rhizobium sp. S152]
MAMAPPVECIIEHHDRGGMLTLVPMINGEGRGQGSYQFEIVSSSGGNTSSNMQGGDFEKTAAGRLSLSQVVVSASDNGWSARLTVYGPTGETLCRISVP